MNRIIAIATATMLATPALAYTGVSPTMVAAVESYLEQAGLNQVAVTSLTDEQVIEIYALSTSNDGTDIQRIKAALDGEGYSRTITDRRMVIVGDDADETGLFRAGMENSTVASVQNWLDKNGYEVDASALSDAQIAELYLLAFGDESEGNQSDRVETIIYQ